MPTVFIILFRGVGGATQLPTAPLRTALSEAGFTGVATYINSGNAVVSSCWGREKTLSIIADICATQFGFTKAIYAPSLEEWEALIAANPFPVAEGAGNLVHAAWLSEAPEPKNADRLRSLAGDGEGMEIIGNTAYLNTPQGFSKSKMALNFDKWIGVPNTARNWNTVLKLHDLGRKAREA